MKLTTNTVKRGRGWSRIISRDGVMVGRIAFTYFDNGSPFVASSLGNLACVEVRADTHTKNGPTLAEASKRFRTRAQAEKWARAHIRSLNLETLFSPEEEK